MVESIFALWTFIAWKCVKYQQYVKNNNSWSINFISFFALIFVCLLQLLSLWKIYHWNICTIISLNHYFYFICYNSVCLNVNSFSGICVEYFLIKIFLYLLNSNFSKEDLLMYPVHWSCKRANPFFIVTFSKNTINC